MKCAPVLAACALTLACRTPSPVVSDQRPSVLLVLVDDLSADIGLYGGVARTPSIDRIAAGGRRFDRAYCQYSQCNPSRTSLFSGWRPERTGVWGNLRNPAPHVRQAVLLQDHFAKQGYYTVRVGKAYHSRFESEFHWSETVETDTAVDANDGDSAGADWGPWPKDEGLLPDVVAARNAVRILTTPRSQPVFLVLGLHEPHIPWLVPERYLRLYDPAHTELPGNSDVPALHSGADIPVPREKWPEAIAAYRAAVTFADDQVGVVTGALARAGTLERTVVVVASDNGYHLADHGHFGKATLLEAGTRVPLVIAGPGVNRPGLPTTALAELVDIYPTLVDLCALPRPPGLDGVSLRPVLQDPALSVKDVASSMLKVGAYRRGNFGRSLRTDRYRFTLWPDGSEELFDYSTDPLEKVNLASVAAYSAARRALKDRLRDLPAVVPDPDR